MRTIELPAGDITLSFVRSSGPGGQNVNKVASAVQLRFDLAGTAALDERVKQRLRALAGQRLTADGALLVFARNHRTQEGNRREALRRLQKLIARALPEPIERRATRPTRASQRRRVERKIGHQRTKRLRARVSLDD